jgi:phosphomannomutase
MPKHFFFDLDSTLTSSRAPMTAAHVPLFDRLCSTCDVVVVTGGAESQIRLQIPVEPTGNFCMLSQQGNHAVAKDGTVLWHETVSPAQEQAVRSFADLLTQELALKVRDPNDLFENRGSQFAYSPLGFHENNEIKYSYDPDQSKRRAFLAQHPIELAALRNVGIEAMPAGSTTIDFILLGKNKGFNITRFLEHEGWNKDDCVYVGDALFPGGNDETVIGVVPAHAVKDPDETFDYIKANLLH